MAEENLKHKTKKGLYWQLLNQFSNYGLQFIVGIFMARMLTPEDYGITALPAVFLAIAGIFAGAGFGTALVRKSEITEEDLATCFYYSTGVGIVSYIILFFASPYIADFYNVPVLCPLIRVTALSFLYGPLGTPQNVILNRRLDFKTPTKISIVCKIFSSIVGIVMAFKGYGVWSLTISGLISGIVGLSMNWYVVRWYPKTWWSNDSFHYLWGFGNKFMASQLLDTAYNNITPVVIGKYYSPAQLGVYNRAENYANMLSRNFFGVISNVTFPILSKMQDDQERLCANYRRIIRTTAFIVFPLMMMLAALARPLIIVMITEKWESCIIFLQLICFAQMWWPIHAFNLNALLVLGRSDLFLRLEMIKKIWGILILACTLPFGLIVFCIGAIISNWVGLAINTYYNGKLLQMGFFRQLRDMFPALFLSFTMFWLILLITYIFDNMIIQIIIGGSVGAIFYIGGAFLLKLPELKDTLYLVQRKSN